MISNDLLEAIKKKYLDPYDKLVSHKFVRELSRKTQTYYYYLYIDYENEFGILITRAILLGTSQR